VSEIHPLGRRDTHEHITLFEHSQRFKDAVIEPGPLDAEFSVEVAVPIDDRTEGVPSIPKVRKDSSNGGPISWRKSSSLRSMPNSSSVSRKEYKIPSWESAMVRQGQRSRTRAANSQHHLDAFPTYPFNVNFPLGRMKFRNRMRPQRLASTSTFSTTNTPSSLIDHLRKAWDIDARPPSSMNPYASAWPAKSL